MGHRTVSSPSARSTRVPGRGRPPPSQPRSSFPPPARGDVLPASGGRAGPGSGRGAGAWGGPGAAGAGPGERYRQDERARAAAGLQHPAVGGAAHCLHHLLRGHDPPLRLHPPPERQEAHAGAGVRQVRAAAVGPPSAQDPSAAGEPGAAASHLPFPGLPRPAPARRPEGAAAGPLPPAALPLTPHVSFPAKS